MWSTPEDKKSGRSIHDVLAMDKEIVRTVFLLCGALDGAKRTVANYLALFFKYEWLWQVTAATAATPIRNGHP